MKVYAVIGATLLAIAPLIQPGVAPIAEPAVVAAIGAFAGAGSFLLDLGDQVEGARASSSIVDDSIVKVARTDIDADVDESLKEIKTEADEADPPTPDEEVEESRLPSGVPKYVYRMCKRELKGRKVHVKSHNFKSATFRNVPPTCMTLSNVWIGDGRHGPRPVPCGSACMAYHGMTKNQHRKLVRTLQAHSGHHHRGGGHHGKGHHGGGHHGEGDDEL